MVPRANHGDPALFDWILPVEDRWGEKWTEIEGRGQWGQDTEVGHLGKVTGRVEGQREKKSGRERETDKGGGTAEREVDRE